MWYEIIISGVQGDGTEVNRFAMDDAWRFDVYMTTELAALVLIGGLEACLLSVVGAGTIRRNRIRNEKSGFFFW